MKPHFLLPGFHKLAERSIPLLFDEEAQMDELGVVDDRRDAVATWQSGDPASFPEAT